MTTKLKRTAVGRYYTTNGRPILDPLYVSATVVRVGKSWVTTYRINWRDEVQVNDGLLNDARIGVAAALNHFPINRVALESAHAQAVASAITAQALKN